MFVAAIFSTSAWAYCWEEAGAEYGINPQLLQAVSSAESGGNQSAVNPNGNGSYDACHMQVNTRWYFRLKKLHGKEYADRVWSALSDPCYCTRFGAFVLSDCIARFGETWRAVGCYNAADERKAAIYARRVYDEWRGAAGR